MSSGTASRTAAPALASLPAMAFDRRIRAVLALLAGVIRDAETETMLRNFATPLFRAAGLHPNLVRIIVIRDDAINSFVSTGNRMFIASGLIESGLSGRAPTRHPSSG